MDITSYQAPPPARRPGRIPGLLSRRLGFEVRGDVEYNGMHWITVGPSDQPGVRDCAFRDPAGNLIRIQEQR